LDVVAEDIRQCDGRRLEHDRLPGPERSHLEYLQLPAQLQIEPVLRDEAVDEAVRLARTTDGRAADVFDDPDVAVGIGLDALVASPPEHAEQIFGGRREIRRRLPDATGRGAVSFLAEQQAFGERVPGRSVEYRERRAVR